MIELNYRRHEGVDLARALALLGDGIALATSPAGFAVGQVREGELDLGAATFDGIYHLRAFARDGRVREVRWRAPIGAPPHAVVVTTDNEAHQEPDADSRKPSPLARLRGLPAGRRIRASTDPADEGGSGMDETATCIAFIPQRYLVWGRCVTGAPNGWSRFSEARVAAIDLPVDATPGATAQLVAREFVAVDGHGNAHVIDELLIDIDISYRKERSS